MKKNKLYNPKIDFNRDAYFAAVPRDINGLPIFKGEKTFWGIALGYNGEIVVDGKTYLLNFGMKSWFVAGIMKKDLPKNVHLICLRLFQEFKQAIAEEKLINKSTRIERNTENIKLQRADGTLSAKNKLMIAQSQIQVNEIYKMVIDGKSRFEISNILKDKYDYSERRINQLLKEVHSIIMTNVVDERGTLKEKHVAQLDELYKLNIERGDYKEARLIIDQKQKMLGLNESEKKEVEVKHTYKFKFDTPLLPEQNPLDTPFEDVTNIIPIEYRNLSEKEIEDMNQEYEQDKDNEEEDLDVE